MPSLRLSSSHLTRNLLASELGCHVPNPSIAPFFKTFRTRPTDEYGFWNVNSMGDPVAVPPFTSRFATKACNGHAVLIGDEDGILTVLDTRRSLRDQMRVVTPSDAPPARFRAHDNAIFDAIWMSNDTRIASASGDATVRVLDPETLFRTALCRGATQSVKCVRTLNSDCSDSVLVSSGRDGAIRLHDLRVPSIYDPSVCREMFHKPVFEIQRAHSPPITVQATPTKRRRISAPEPFASVTSLTMVPGKSNLMFSSGAADGSVKLWDIRVGGFRRCGSKVDSQCIESITPSEEPRGDSGSGRRRRHGIASLDIDASGTKLLASSTDSSIYLYDTQQLGLGHSEVLRGHTATSFYVRACFSPCGRFVASGSADSMGYIWDLENTSHGRSLETGGKPIVRLDGHRGGDVSVVEWCKSDMFKLVTCGDDTTVKVWRANCKDVKKSEFENREREEKYGKEEGYGLSHKMEDENEEDGSEETNNRSRRSSTCSKRLRDTDIRSFFGNKSSSASSRKRQKSNVNISSINNSNNNNNNSGDFFSS